jgi:hypothetical protein
MSPVDPENKMKATLISATALLLGNFLTQGAHAALSTDAASFGGIDEDFESYDGLVTQGPASIGGGATWTSGIDSTLGAFAVDLGDNGTWGAGNNFAGIGDLFNGGTEYNGAVTVMFNAASFGAGAQFSIFQIEGGTAAITLEALGAGNAVLEAHSFVINFADPFLNNASTFYGIGRDTAEMTGLRISGDGFVLDDLRIATSPVPVPAALPLLLSGIGLLSAAARRRAG